MPRLKRCLRRALLVTLSLMVVCRFAVSQCPKKATRCVTIVRHENGGTVSSTSFDNQAHAQAVGTAVAEATKTALNFYFVEWPELQRIRNERISRSEGQFAPLYEGLDFLTIVPVEKTEPTASLSSTTLKSHHLNESWSDFLLKAPVLASHVEKCRQEKRPKDIAAKAKFIPCSTVWPLIDGALGPYTFDCIDMSHAASKGMFCRDFDGEATFTDGKLSSLKVAIEDAWPHVYGELCDRFGEPSAADDEGSFEIWNV